MECLLDTHVVLWALGNKAKLSAKVAHLLIDPTSEHYVSIASAWELAIKIGKGNLTFKGGIERFFRMLDKNGFEVLPITETHVKRLETLPLLHKDPFDRLLISSALAENLTIITADENIRKYDVPCVW